MSRANRTNDYSRERNRIHARKTRQRKKEQMQGLQGQADNLKQEQMRLRQIINEKNTANILVGLFATSDQIDKRKEDPAVEELLRRPVNEIPDSSKISELPALILPGHHASKKLQATNARVCALDVGIDYQLLGKDRSKCTPEELDQIRRERNRMHAKRTRDRKRMFMEEMAEMCRILKEENDMLRAHLAEIDPGHEDAVSKVTSDAALDSFISSPVVSSPQLLPLAPKFELLEVSSNPSVLPTKKNAPSLDQIQALLDAAIKSERASVKRTQDGDRFYSMEDESCNERRGDSCPLPGPCKRKRHSSSLSFGHRLDSTAAVGC